MTPTLKSVKLALDACAMRISRQDGEFRVNFAHGHESTAYYTTDIEDALATGYAMAKHRGTI
jgi:hypothetical protein